MKLIQIKKSNEVMKSLLTISSLLFILSCNNLNQSIRGIKKHLYKIEQQITLDKSGIENFNSFFEFFKKDTIFQFERTSLPFVSRVELITINAAGDLKANIITSSDKTEWQPVIWEAEKYQKIETKNDSIFMSFNFIALSKEETSTYIFIRSNGKWYLKTLEIK